MEMKKALEALEGLGGNAEQKKIPDSKDVGFATIERLCLITENITISFPNISRLTFDWAKFAAKTEPHPNASRWRLAAGAAALILFVLYPHPVTAGLGILVFALGLKKASAIPHKVLLPGYTRYKIQIHTNDGATYQFSSLNEQAIKSVRRIITDKMNGQDEAAVYNINFEQGVIQNMGINNVGSVGAIVSGQGNQVMAATDNARVNTSETITNITRIDYSEALPTIAQWRAHFESQNQRDVAARFDELERLLKAGTPTQKDRYRLRDLLQDLGAMFSASTQAIQLFDLIRKLAGI